MTSRVSRIDLQRGHIFDIDGGVWYPNHQIQQHYQGIDIAESRDDYQRLNLSPVIEGLGSIFLGSNHHLVTTLQTTISDELKQLTIRDLIIDSNILVLTDEGVLYWCKIEDNELRIHRTISINVVVMDMIDDDIDSIIVMCVFNDKMQVIYIDSSSTEIKSFDLQGYIPEGIKSIENNVIITNSNRIMIAEFDNIDDLGARDTIEHYILTTIDIVKNMIDVAYYNKMWSVLTDNTCESYMYIDGEKWCISSTILQFKPYRLIDYCISKRLPTNYVESENGKIYKVLYNKINEVSLPMNISRRLARVKSIKSVRLTSDCQNM